MNTAYAVASQATDKTESVSELTRLLSMIVQKLPLFFAGLFILVLSFFLAKIVKSIVENKLSERGLDDEHKEVQVLSGRLVYAIVLVIGVTAGLNIAGIDITSIIAAAAFGIGFALKDLIVNFLAGIMILLGRDITIGDFIKVNGQVGKIEAIQGRVTILKAINGTKIVVPNSVLFKNKVTSFTGNPLRRFDLVVPVDFRQNIENVIKIMLYSASITEGVLAHPPAKVGFVDLGDKGFKLKLKAWCEGKSGWLKVRTKLAKNLISEFRKHNIVFPFTTYNINNFSDVKIDEKAFLYDNSVVPQASVVAQGTVAQGVVPQGVVAQGNFPQDSIPQSAQMMQNQTIQSVPTNPQVLMGNSSAVNASQTPPFSQSGEFTEEEINAKTSLDLSEALVPQPIMLENQEGQR